MGRRSTEFENWILARAIIMPWDPKILEQFELVNRFTTDETEFYGPFNTLLTHLFPFSESFQIAPQFKGPVSQGSIDFTTIYIIRKRKFPVFFVEIKPYVHLSEMGTRTKADEQMRERFGFMIETSLVIPKLYGVSAMGTQFSVYEYTKESGVLNPELIERDPKRMNDTAPKERWSHDLLEESGEERLRALVNEVKAMCANI